MIANEEMIFHSACIFLKEMPIHFMIAIPMDVYKFFVTICIFVGILCKANVITSPTLKTIVEGIVTLKLNGTQIEVTVYIIFGVTVLLSALYFGTLLIMKRVIRIICKIFAIYSMMLTNILAYQFYSFCFLLLQQRQSLFDPTPITPLNMATSIIFAILNLVLTLFVSIFTSQISMEKSLNTSNSLAFMSSKLLVWKIVINVCLCFTICFDLVAVMLAGLIVICLFSGVLLVMHIFSSKLMNKIVHAQHIIRIMAEFWLSVGCIFNIFVGVNCLQLFLIIIMLAINVVYFQLKSYYDSICIKNFLTGNIKGIDQIEIALMKFINSNSTEITEYLIMHHKECNSIECNCNLQLITRVQETQKQMNHKKSISLSVGKSTMSFAKQDNAEKKDDPLAFAILRLTLMKHIDKPFVAYYVALVEFYILKATYKSVFSLLYSYKFALTFNQRSLIYQLKYHIQNKIDSYYDDSHKSGKVTMRNIIATHEQLIKLIMSIKHACECFYKFLKELLGKTPNIIRFIEIGNETTEVLALVDYFYSKLNSLTNINYKGTVYYMLFAKLVEEDNYKAGELFLKIKQHKLALRNTKSFAESDERIYGLNSKIAYIKISANHSTLGKIISCNDEMRSLLGFTPKECVGMMMNKLMPESIGKVHNSFILNYFERSDHQTSVRANVFGLHKEGYIVPIAIYTHIFPCIDQDLQISAFMSEVTALSQILSIEDTVLTCNAMIFMIDMDSKIQGYNKAVPNILHKNACFNNHKFLKEYQKPMIKTIFPEIWSDNYFMTSNIMMCDCFELKKLSDAFVDYVDNKIDENVSILSSKNDELSNRQKGIKCVIDCTIENKPCNYRLLIIYTPTVGETSEIGLSLEKSQAMALININTDQSLVQSNRTPSLKDSVLSLSNLLIRLSK